MPEPAQQHAWIDAGRRTSRGNRVSKCATCGTTTSADVGWEAIPDMTNRAAVEEWLDA